jgi:hypothetical protein
MRLDDTAALRRIILRTMLGALAVSAALAVFGVLVGKNDEQSARMIATGVSAAIASALLLASCKFLDSEKMRRTGLFVMAMILAQFILVLVALWCKLWVSGAYRNEEALAMVAVTFPITWIPAALFFHIRQLPGGRLAGLIGIVSCCIALVFFVLGACNDGGWLQGGSMSWVYWGTAWACWFFAFGSAANFAGIGVNKNHWRWIGMAAAILSFGLGLRYVWAGYASVSNLFIVATTLAILIGHANLLWLCNLKPNQRWLRWVTAIFAWVAGVILDDATIQSVTDDFTWRIATAAAICAGCGTVAVAILTAFNRRIAPRPSAGIDAAQIDIVCPICHKKQTLPITNGIADSTCTGCGIIISVRLRAPRCPTCDYTLLMLKADCCPECGTPIAGSRASVGLPTPAPGT